MESNDTDRSAARRGDEKTGERALAWAAGRGVGERIRAGVEAEVKRIRRRRLAAAGAFCLVVACVPLWQVTFGRKDSVQPVALSASTSAIVARPERILLADGSVVELREGASIVTAFTDRFRRVTLQRGEAYFQVSKDAARPFIVSAGGVEARAVGTAFGVHMGNLDVEVLVTEGSVSVGRPRETAPITTAPTVPETIAVVKAGNRVVVEAVSSNAFVPIQPVSAPELADRHSWRVPRLEFSFTPLSEVIPLFNEHSSSHIVLGDPALGRLQLSGTLRADNTGSLLRLLELEFGIKAERGFGNEVVLHRP